MGGTSEVKIDLSWIELFLFCLVINSCTIANSLNNISNKIPIAEPEVTHE